MALRILAGWSRTRHQLRAGLRRRGFTEAAVEAAIRRLEALRYLDDSAVAAAHVRGRSGRYGPDRLRAELKARGVEDAVVAEVLRHEPGADPESQAASVRRLLVRSLDGGDGDRAVRRAVAAASRRGFDPAVIWRVLRELRMDAEHGSQGPD